MPFDVIPISDLVQANEASVKTGPFGTQLKAGEYTETGTPVINVRNVGLGSVREAKLEFIPAAVRARLSGHLLQAEDIVFGRKGAVERHAFIRLEQSGWLQGSDCIRLRIAKDARLLPQFVSYCLLTTAHKEWMEQQCSHGATMASLNQDIVERIQVPFPPLPIQRRIAGILSAYDDLIEVNTRRIKALEEMARRTYEEWFVHYRHPGGDGTRPDGWEVVTLGDAFEITGGGTPSRQEPAFWVDGNINWYSPTDLTKSGHVFMDRSTDQITDLGLRKSSARLFPPNSVMLTSRATIGAVAINTTEACTNQGFITCLPNERITLFYLYHLIKDKVPEFIRHASGATFKEISKGVFKGLPFELPSSSAIAEYETFSAPIMIQVQNLEDQNTNLSAQRDLLLPRLVSGAIDVSDAEATLPVPAEVAAE